jgi:hypothetical protein
LLVLVMVVIFWRHSATGAVAGGNNGLLDYPCPWPVDQGNGQPNTCGYLLVLGMCTYPGWLLVWVVAIALFRMYLIGLQLRFWLTRDLPKVLSALGSAPLVLCVAH